MDLVEQVGSAQAGLTTRLSFRAQRGIAIIPKEGPVSLPGPLRFLASGAARLRRNDTPQMGSRKTRHLGDVLSRAGVALFAHTTSRRES
jgi:hypothetical protein